MKNFLKISVNWLMCLLLTMSLILTCIFLSILANTNSRSLNKYIVSSGYSSIVSNKILNQLYHYADINSLPHDIFDEFVNSTFMSSEIYEYIISISQNEEDSKYLMSIDKKKSELSEKIKNYALNNMNLTDNQRLNIDKNVNDFTNECLEVYKNNIKSNILKKASQYVGLIDKYFIYFSLLLISIDLSLSLILILIQKWKHRGYRYILYSLISCELMLVILTGYFYINNIIKRLAIISEEMYNLITTILNKCLSGLCISILILAILIFINSYFYRKYRRRT